MNIKAKKKFGQNFLKDKSIVEEIIKAIPNSNHKLIEIGPGLGDLTEHLLKSQDVVAFEIDLDLCKYLNDKFSEEIESGKLQLICGDVLEFWSSGKLMEDDYKIVANLPYYIATNIILKALQDSSCNSITVMIQKEVADKFLADVGEREFSSLSVIAQSLGDVRHIVEAPPSAFDPPPKVVSSVIEFKKLHESLSSEFLDFLRSAFQQPRKTLMKNLSQKYSREYLEKIFEQLDLTQSIRPHQVDKMDYHQIYEMLEDLKIGRERGVTKT